MSEPTRPPIDLAASVAVLADMALLTDLLPPP